MAVLALLLPFGMNWICLFCGGVVHDLMMYAYIVPLLAALAANERAWNLALADEGKQIGKKTRAAACVLPLAVLTLLFDRGIYANQIYLKKDLEYDTTLSGMTRVVDRIEQVEGYIPGETPVKFLGDIQRSKLAMTRPGLRTSWQLDRDGRKLCHHVWRHLLDVSGRRDGIPDQAV